MNTHEDFEEFLRLLTAEKVEFVIVGGYAVAFYGHVRTTQDLDLFFRNTERNVRKILAALRRFGLPADDSAITAFREPGSIIRLGVAPVRIEMINAISGLTFGRVWQARRQGLYGSVPTHYISRTDLLANKRASGRPKDLADVDELGGNR